VLSIYLRPVGHSRNITRHVQGRVPRQQFSQEKTHNIPSQVASAFHNTRSTIPAVSSHSVSVELKMVKVILLDKEDEVMQKAEQQQHK
jgi:hypothetical protein